MNKSRNYWLYKWLHFQQLFSFRTTNGSVTRYVVNIATVRSCEEPAVLIYSWREGIARRRERGFLTFRLNNWDGFGVFINGYVMGEVCVLLDFASVHQSNLRRKRSRLGLANVIRSLSLCLHSSCLCLSSCRSCEKKKVHIIAWIVFNGLEVCKCVQSLWQRFFPVKQNAQLVAILRAVPLEPRILGILPKL